MILRISEVIGQSCISREDGQKLFKLIYPQIKAGEAVGLDFDGVRYTSLIFLNYGIGQLYRDIEQEQVDSRLTTINLSDIGNVLCSGVREVTPTYYRRRKAL